MAPYIGYKPQKITDEFPDIVMGFFTNVLAYSHSTHTIYQITNSINNHVPDQIISYMFDKFKEKTRDQKDNPIKFDKTELLQIETGFKSNTSQQQWEISWRD